MTFFVAASDSSAEDKATANAVCSGSNDRTILQRAWGRPGERVYLLDGTYHVDCGANGVDGNPYLYPAAGVIIIGGPGVILQATNGICRITVQHENVHIFGLTCRGYVAIQWYCTANHLTIEDTSITHSLDGKTYLPFGKRGGATAAFMGWGSVGKTMTGITIRNCTATMTYHHGFSLNLGNGPEGGGFKDILIEGCKAISCGSGQETSPGKNAVQGDRDWSCGFDIPDAGDITNLHVLNCDSFDSWQDEFHIDGSWDGHRQRCTNVVFENCTATNAGQRSGHTPTELYQSGFYVQDALLINCKTRNCKKAGYLLKNEHSGAAVLEGCSSDGDAYSLVSEVGGSGAVVTNFTSTGATRRALQMVGSNVKITGFKIERFAGKGKPVLMGLYERLEFVDAPSHAKDLARYRGITYNVNGTMDFLSDSLTRTGDLIEVHAGSRVDMSRINLSCWTPAPEPGTDPIVPSADPVVIVTPPRTEPLPAVPDSSDPVIPPIPAQKNASFTVTPLSGRVGDRIRFKVIPAVGKTIKSAWWTFDANAYMETWNSRDVNPSFYFQRAGTFSPLVKITYTDGTQETVKMAGGVKIS